MAIYQPPKQSSTGGVMSGIGSGMASAGGIMATTGIGAPIGLAVAGIGSLLNVTGNIVDGNNKKKLEEYEVNYANEVQGEKNINTSYQNNLQQSRNNYTQSGVNSSLAAINGMLNPASSNIPSNGGTGFNNKRLI